MSTCSAKSSATSPSPRRMSAPKAQNYPSASNANPAVYRPGATTANINARRLYRADYQASSTTASMVNSSYNALQATLNKRFSKGYTIMASYTYGRSLDMPVRLRWTASTARIRSTSAPTRACRISMSASDSSPASCGTSLARQGRREVDSGRLADQRHLQRANRHAGQHCLRQRPAL